MANAPISKQKIIDLLVLVFSHSAVKDLVGTDALRSVLAIRYQDMVRGERFELEPLWGLLCDQPNFEPAAAAPAVCKFKTFQDHIGLEVVLPEALADTDQESIDRWAREVVVPAAELKKALRLGEPAPLADGQRTSKKAGRTGKRDSLADIINEANEAETSSAKAKAKNKSSGDSVASRLMGWEIPLAIVAVLTLGFAGYTVYEFTIAGASYEQFSGNFGDIPVKKVQKLGNQVGGVLTDPQWLSSPGEQRRDQLREVLDHMQAQGVNVVYVMSDEREVYATASYRNDGTIKVELLK